MASKPTIVFIPGSFSPRRLYEKFILELHAAGFDSVEFVDLPSIGRKDPAPAATMADDAAAVRKVYEKHAEAGADILVVAHSYGGVPASNAVEGLAKSHRQQEGKKGGIVRILYTTALVPAVGKSLNDIMGGGNELPEYVKMNDAYMWLEPTSNAKLNFSDLPYEEALEWAQKGDEHSTVTFIGQLTYAGYKDAPVSYISCEDDYTVPPVMQQKCIDTIEEAAGKIDVRKIKTGHFAFVSRPDLIVDVVKQVSEISS